jgi:siroheme synthase
MSGRYFPIFYDLRGARVLVAGAGKVAERKIGRLLAHLPRLAEEAGIRSPSLLFVGKTAALALAGDPDKEILEEGIDGPVAQSV